MVRPAEYSPARRSAMQATLVAVLGGVIGLAAIVDGQFARANRLALTPPQTNGPLHFQLPERWRNVSDDQLLAPLVASATDPNSFRMLKIFRQRLARPMTPMEYLDQSGMLADIFGYGDQSGLAISSTTLAGAPAQMVAGLVDYQNDQEQWREAETVICAVFPDSQAVTIFLSDRGPEMQSDDALLAQIASTIHVDPPQGN